MIRIVKNTILITILLGLMLLTYDYFTNERLNSRAKLKFTEMCKNFPTVEGDDLIHWKALKERVNNKNIEETKIVFGITVTRAITPNQVHCCFGFGPRFSGASLSPVLASISANHALDPTGRPTLSALRNAA